MHASTDKGMGRCRGIYSPEESRTNEEKGQNEEEVMLVCKNVWSKNAFHKEFHALSSEQDIAEGNGNCEKSN